MSDGRLARGWPVLGCRRLRQFVIAGLAVVFAVVVVGSASAASGPRRASGGAGIHTRLPHEKKRKQRPAASARGQPSNPFALRGMWIWLLPDASGGSVSAIISRAHQYGIGTLIIKSGDGTGTWSQFNPQLVAELHAAGLRVCGWQYVYGNNPIAEAEVGAAAVHDGANCLAIDAESEYEGKYVQAQTYITELRKLIGAKLPVALAGLPYVDFHPSFPYSIFLGPGGAQYNMPQMYWSAIGVTVDQVYAHTYAWNRPYARSIYHLGEIDDNPPIGQILRFRQLSRVYGAPNVSWWDWQEASQAAWNGVARPVASLTGYTASAAIAAIGRGYAGDLAVWAQEHLLSAGYPITVNGSFGATMQAVVESFQTAHGLTPDGVIGPQTWIALLRYPPANVRWTTRRAKEAAAARAALTMPVPKSARLPAKRDELAGISRADTPAAR